MVNKLVRSCISVETVVKSSLYHRGYAMKSVQNLAVLMDKKAIYPPSALRLLRLVNGKRCEFCFNAPVSPVKNKGLVFQFKQDANPLPRYVRPTCGFFACWYCMEQWRHPDISGSSKYPSITRKWHKLFFDPRSHKYYHKQYYLCNRELFRSIQSHDRVVSYPYGSRWLYRNESGLLVPTTSPSMASIKSRDRFEIMSSQYREDGAHEPIGPIFHYDELRRCIRYLQHPGSLGLDFYLENLIQKPPALNAYEEFTTCYQRHIEPANRRYTHRKADRMNKLQLRRYNQIETAVRVVAAVSKEMTLANLCMKRNIRENMMPTNEDIRAIDTILLSYKEAPQLPLRDVISFDTGCFRTDWLLTKYFRLAFKNPDLLLQSKIRIKEFAQQIYSCIMTHLGRTQMYTLPVLNIGGGVQGAIRSFRPPYLHRRSSKKQWRDTSSERCL